MLQKPLINILFNYKRWKCPFRYIKNNEFENVVKNEISEFFFIHINMMEEKKYLLRIHKIYQVLKN